MSISDRIRSAPLQVDDERSHVGDSSAWLVSLLAHLAFLVVISLLSTQAARLPQLVLTVPPIADPVVEELVQQEFHFETEFRPEIGASIPGGPIEEIPGEIDLPEIPRMTSLEMEPQEFAQAELRQFAEAATGPEQNLNHSVKGTAGAGVTSSAGAIDRITQEIMMSLQERETLVVWFFDQSGSLSIQRREIHRRFRRVYEELGVIESSGHQVFEQHELKPLLTSVVAFGEKVEFPVKQPTDNLQEIQEAVTGIQQDDSGIERVFTAVQMAVGQYGKYRSRSGGSDRNVMFVLFTDEAGDDQEELDKTANICRRLAIPVYVVGVPAPFGREETLVKWVDPDPKFDQSPQWGRVSQGPESLAAERIKIHFGSTREDSAPIDSGFGPFALTRLCFESGGIYFAVHPNRRTDRHVSRRQTNAHSAYIKTFFDEPTMRPYRPDYVSSKEYFRKVRGSRLRSSLVDAARMSAVAQLERPRLRFVVRSEAGFANDLTEAQKAAAKLEPAVRSVFDRLKQGEVSRENELVPRWQAGFDLAMGRLLAVKVRTESYNAMLAKAKRGMKFEDPKNNTWQLAPSNEVTAGSALKGQAERSRNYLSRVADEHAGTPWALLAKRELKAPMSWSWKENRTPLEPPNRNRAANNPQNNPPRAAADEQRRMIQRRPPKRKPPKL